jgi:hypothetical protein
MIAMKTELIVGKFSIHFESQARRRLFVSLFYAAVAVICLAWCSFSANATIGAWILSGCMILGTTLLIVFTSIAEDPRAFVDEREMHRSEHAHFQAYSLFGKTVVATIIANIIFKGHNPITPLVPAALRGGMVQWPQALFMAIGLLYISLPHAILLWTEPDMDM